MGRPSFVSAVRPVGFGLVGSMKTCRPLATTGCGCGCAARAPTATPIGVRVEVRYGGQKRFDQVVSGKGFGKDGGTGVNFFDPDKIDASNIAVDNAILSSLNNIAASADGNTGDNGMALALSSLRNGNILSDGTQTMEGFYYEMLGEVGALSGEAQTMAENHRLFSLQIENRRQSVQGVSLNDEASQLMLFQRAYQAAARTVSIIDELLEVTVNI